jgi:tetratricopeptide (TPR) repeat protein
MATKHKLGEVQLSKSMTSIEAESVRKLTAGTGKPPVTGLSPIQMNEVMHKAQLLYNSGAYTDALSCCEKVYESDAHRTTNLLLLGAIHFQLRNFSESIFYNQQCIRVDANFAEAYSNLGNALKELGDLKGATKFYLKVGCAVLCSFSYVKLSLLCCRLST